jgi:acyl-CoA synthetase (AMP-forming)/AMP-acid ligase II
VTDTTIPTLRLITDHLDRRALERPEQDLLVFGATRITYAETRELVDRTARALIAAGVGKGDRIAMLSGPRPEFFVHFLAVTSVGAIWVGLNPKYTSAELDHVVGDAEPSMLFGFSEVTGEDQLEKLRGLGEAHPSVRRLVLFDDATAADAVGWETFLAGADDVGAEELTARRKEVDPMDPAYLVYTSGSTGRPKGALLTHRGSNLCNVIAVERKGLTDRTLICNLPINHVGAIGDICGRTLTGGGTIHFQEKFSPLDMMQMIERERLNTIGGVPTMLQMCVAHPQFDEIDLTSVDLIAWGGAAMPTDLLRTLMAKTGATRCTMGYGMTETTGGVTYSGLTDPLDLLATTVGTPDPRQPLRIWHSDGREANRDEPGEIQVKGDFTMAGYWRLPEATAEAFTDDGWMRTGDLAVRRDDGYIRIVGRMSEMFKSGGYNVYPREIELAFESHPGVAMAAVVSIPDPTFQEIGIAYVTGDDLDPDGLRTFVRDSLANYKIPKEIIVLDELPMLPIGKVDKPALRARHEAAGSD